MILGLTYSEFDNKIGPQLRFAYPCDILSKDIFESYSEYVIMSKPLCDKVITVFHKDMKFMNYSVAIENPKYHRNTLTFAFGLILHRESETEYYENALRKISYSFVHLETETEILFSNESKQQIPDILKILFEDLNSKMESFTYLDKNNVYVAVKLFRNSWKKAQRVEDYHVPSFRFDKIDLSWLPWDVTYQHLIPHIDGVSNVHRIAISANMDISVAKRCLELLLFQGCIFVTDAMKFTNMYQLNVDIALQIFSNSTIMNEMRMYSAWDPNHYPSESQSTFNDQTIHFLLQFQPGRFVRDLLLDGLENIHPSFSIFMKDINISKVIVFAQAQGILRRLHEYPIYMHHHQQQPSIPSIPTTTRSLNYSPIPLSIVDTEKQHRKTITFNETTTKNGSGISYEFQKLNRKSESVIGKNYLRKNEMENTTNPKNKCLTLAEVVSLLTGDLPLDYICCKYNVSYKEIVQYPGVHIVYK